MEKPFFSVVVIACDVEKYLRRCLNSIAAQDFASFEIFLGVEKSKDATEEIAADFSKANRNCVLRVLPRSGSASQIRNCAIEEGKGRYLLFIDGDDWIEPDSLKRFYTKISETDFPDVVFAGASVWKESTSEPLKKVSEIFCGNYPQVAISGAEFLNSVCRIGNLRTATWMSAYSTQFLRDEKLYQPFGRRHQDDEWTPRVLLAADKLACLKFAYYNYLVRAGSITNTPNPKSVFDIAANVGSFMNYWNCGGVPEELKPSFATWYMDYVCKLFYSRHESSVRAKAYSEVFCKNENFAALRDMSKYASTSKKLLLPICRVARIRGAFGLADCIFKYIYSPIIFGKWREKLGKAARRAK